RRGPMYKNLSPRLLGISGRDSEIIELVLSYGFKGLELDLVEFAAEVEKHGFARASRLIVSARLKIGSFSLPADWNSDKVDLTRRGKLAELANQLGCTRATVTIEPGDDARPYHENFEFHRRRLVELAEALAVHKIRLGVGFVAPVACRADRRFQF